MLFPEWKHWLKCWKYKKLQTDYQYAIHIFMDSEADQNSWFDSFLYVCVFVYVSLSQISLHQLFIQ